MALLVAVPLQAEDESPIPHQWPIAHYQQMKAESPFALATPVAPAAEPQASFAANWFVIGIGKLDDQEFVTIKARDLSTQFSLFGHEANPANGVILTNIEWSEKIGKSIVTIKKGTETARLEFNEAEISPPAQVTTAAAPSGGAKGAARPAQGNPPPASTLRPLPPFSPPPHPNIPGAMTPPGHFIIGEKKHPDWISSRPG